MWFFFNGNVKKCNGNDQFEKKIKIKIPIKKMVKLKETP